ncbi:cytochrome bd-I ubiquinol oxidase subunit 1 apoprotein [Streptosporangium subroseum]|uniref:Cytochrome bd-I ubiquinol oxidase subunit 1 apoprotein n=1 Tax=Streptosporangium subroseum TaxID=106412 RepID=A0A239NV67_9ACTN|nr:cytochrome ubiquinol oxidase subunit I [Streptosporangium subroseum]SNT58602.1 cytochrome bd-I ubiquinol oxidase subunit 1 apoprotein [Streptosporangium subroseum]
MTVLVALAGPASPADLAAARLQMALSLGWHIVLACLGVGMPALLLFTEWRAIRTGDGDYLRLARRWAKAVGVLFAVGAVSGTILSFEMGLLWPGLMGTYGQVIGLPFAMEGIAFFVEAIFLGIYLYAWDRLSPRAHLLSGVPILIAGVASAFFVVSANAWMNQPVGFDLENGRVTGVDPWRAMFNPATPPQTLHMIVAAFMVAGFATASVYAVAMLRGRRDRYHRLGFVVPFTMAAVLAPVQILVGDYAARFLAERQPTKLAAMEGIFHTRANAPLSLGGFAAGGEMRYAIEIPSGLSLLVGFSPDTVVQGLERVPPADRPPVTPVHLAFDTMVGLGSFLLLLSAWFAVTWWRRRELPRSRWFLRLAAVSGVAAVVAVECGWVVTEVGRQPWVVYGKLRTIDAVNPAPGLWAGFVIVSLVYLVLTVAIVYVLRRMTRAPQEPE